MSFDEDVDVGEAHFGDPAERQFGADADSENQNIENANVPVGAFAFSDGEVHFSNSVSIEEGGEADNIPSVNKLIQT